MGETYSEIPDSLVEWIKKQHMFWVASAPLSADGHVNISPKGVAGTFHVESSTQVWYEDLSGSGAETIAHIRENGRVTVLFNAFDGPPRILRLYGTGSFYELGSAEYESRLPPGTRQPGSRAIIIVEVHQVGTTCGYSVPYYSFVGHRTPLLDWAARKEAIDLNSSTATAQVEKSLESRPHVRNSSAVETHPNGMLTWWRDRNTLSLDGLPALSLAFGQPSSSLGNHIPVRKARYSALNQYPPSKQPVDDSPLSASAVFYRGLWSWITLFIQWVSWDALIHRLSAAITSLNVFGFTLLHKKKSELSSNTSARTWKTIDVPRTVIIHGQEFQESLHEAGEAQRPPVSWGVEDNSNANDNHRVRPMTTPLRRTSKNVFPPLLGYGLSFLLGVMFVFTFAEVHMAGTHAAASLFRKRSPLFPA